MGIKGGRGGSGGEGSLHFCSSKEAPSINCGSLHTARGQICNVKKASIHWRETKNNEWPRFCCKNNRQPLVKRFLCFRIGLHGISFVRCFRRNIQDGYFICPGGRKSQSTHGCTARSRLRPASCFLPPATCPLAPPRQCPAAALCAPSPAPPRP